MSLDTLALTGLQNELVATADGYERMHLDIEDENVSRCLADFIAELRSAAFSAGRLHLVADLATEQRMSDPSPFLLEDDCA